jgi:hypothetical protein
VSPDDENKKLRDLLWRMREEADEAHRNCDPKKSIKYHFMRDLKLFREVEELLGPTTWDALDSTTHIEWGDQAICHWTFHPPAQWPPTQKAVKITKLIVQLPCAEDETLVEFVARPDADWSGVTCDACRIRLPAILREVSGILDDLHEGILEGARVDPETIRAGAEYKRLIEPTLTAEQRQRYAEQAQHIGEKNARRAARRLRERHAKESP